MARTDRGEIGGGAAKGLGARIGKMKISPSTSKPGEKIKTEVIQSRSVRTRPANAVPSKKDLNAANTKDTNARKSGELAKAAAKKINVGKPKETIKIKPDAKKKG